MIKIFKKGFAGDYRVKMTPRKLQNLCELKWASSEVGRSPEGTLNLPTVHAMYEVVTGTPRHPDQFPYTDTWLLIAQILLLWERFCTNGQRQSREFLVQPFTRKKLEEEKPIFQRNLVEDAPCLHHMFP